MIQSSQLDQTVNFSNEKIKKVVTKLAKPDAFLTKIFGEYEFYRYGIISVLLSFVVCLGGLAVAMGAMVNPIEILIIVLPTVGTLTLVLAVAPMKLVLYTGLVSSTVSILAILFHAIM